MDKKPDTGKKLKLIAIVLPEPLFSYVKKEQHFIRDTWGCMHALRTPPHITLIPPLWLTGSEVHTLDAVLKKAAVEASPFMLSANKFDAFRPRVIFLHPENSMELRNLYSKIYDLIRHEIPGVLEKFTIREFHPHITLAFRDLDQKLFKEIWKYYKNKDVKFEVDIKSYHILENTRDGWKMENEYLFQNTVI